MAPPHCLTIWFAFLAQSPRISFTASVEYFPIIMNVSTALALFSSRPLGEKSFYCKWLLIRILSIQLLLVTQFVFCRPIQFLDLTILQNHSVNILSTIKTFPHPKVFGSIINLFIDHHATTTIAFRKSFTHPPVTYDRQVLLRLLS